MFVRGIPILISSAVDTGNLPAPRPCDVLADKLGQNALRTLQAPAEYMPLSERLQDPDQYMYLQQKRRAQLESLLWIEPNPGMLECMLDLIVMICEEGSWSVNRAGIDDPARPAIDVQAAETGVLFAWLLRRHGARLAEYSPRIQSLMLSEVRRRLLGPILAHEDYPFMALCGRCPALIMSDLLITCVLMEKNPARRQQPVKLLLRLLDKICASQSDPSAPIEERVADACAIADLARMLKRVTRGEFDLTRSAPPAGWLDDLIIPWIHGDTFVNPAGETMRPRVAGMDLFRLGHLTRERSLCALGVQLGNITEQPGFSLSGRILNMEYMRAAQDECGNPPRLRRAAAENGSLMVSRLNSMFAAISGMGNRANAGDVTLFADSSPILVDAGGAVHSLPVIDGCSPVFQPVRLPHTDADFGQDRDLMSVDLTETYPEACPIAAYQRTLITSRADGVVRLVDAFEFAHIVQEVTFRFVTAQKPISLRESVRLGPVDLSWDGEMLPEITELPACDAFPGGSWLVSLRLQNVPRRFICGFTFEQN